MHALETLRSIPMGERIAIYAVGRKLQVICEFTPDRELLERQLRMWTPQIDTPGKSGGILETNEANAPKRFAVKPLALMRSSVSHRTIMRWIW